MSDKQVDRRGFIRKSVAASAGVALGLRSFEEQDLLAQMAQGDSGAKAKANRAQAKQGEMPMGRIKDLKVSRLFCGGNLIGGWAHSRDLVYVSSLV